MKAYPRKVLLAWGEAMAGNPALTAWLRDNGYAELISCIASIKGNTTADKWLMTKGHPEMLAFVEAINEKVKARNWLVNNGYDVLVALSDYVNEEDDALLVLHRFGRKELIILGQRLKKLVSDVDTDAGDVHKSPFL